VRLDAPESVLIGALESAYKHVLGKMSAAKKNSREKAKPQA
jgi:hypothetical protein